LFQGIANWGAERGGVVGDIAVNAGAALNAASEALGTNDLGEAVGEGDALGAGLALAGMLPVGKGAKGVGLVDDVVDGVRKLGTTTR